MSSILSAETYFGSLPYLVFFHHHVTVTIVMLLWCEYDVFAPGYHKIWVTVSQEHKARCSTHTRCDVLWLTANVWLKEGKVPSNKNERTRAHNYTHDTNAHTQSLHLYLSVDSLLQNWLICDFFPRFFFLFLFVILLTSSPRSFWISLSPIFALHFIQFILRSESMVFSPVFFFRSTIQSTRKRW